jgi:hypothetical protein
VTCGQRRRRDPSWHFGYAVSLRTDEQLQAAKQSIIDAYNTHCGEHDPLLSTLRVIQREQYERKTRGRNI